MSSLKNTMVRNPWMLVLVLAMTSATVAGAAIRDARREGQFAQLHNVPAAERGVVSGTVGGFPVQLSLGFNQVVGTTSAGNVNLVVNGNVAYGTVGFATVRLVANGVFFTGVGARGAVNLRWIGNTVQGLIGGYRVNLVGVGGTLSGYIGNTAVQLFTGPVNFSVAALIASVL